MSALNQKQQLKRQRESINFLRALMEENPDLAYHTFKAYQSVFNVSGVEAAYGIPAGSLDSAKKNESQASFKHSPKLAKMFDDIFSSISEANLINNAKFIGDEVA